MPRPHTPTALRKYTYNILFVCCAILICVVVVVANKRKKAGGNASNKKAAVKPGGRAVASASVKRTRPYRTPQNPHEQVGADDKEYVVRQIVAKCKKKGVVHYEVDWQGWEKTTWEPIANLVGCSSMLKEFEHAAELEAKAIREAAILKAYERKAAKDKERLEVEKQNS